MEENKAIFREPVAPTPDNFETGEFKKSDIEPDATFSEEGPKPSEYIRTNRPPLVVDILGIRMAYGKLHTKEQAGEVDQFINSEIERQKAKDSKESYEKLYESIVKKLNLEGEQNEFTKLEKIAEYARIQTKLQEAIKETEELLAGDPLDMPLPKMRKALELRYGTNTR